MAHTVRVTELMDAARHLVVHVYLQHDGASPDILDFCLLDPTVDVTPNQKARPTFAIEELWYDVRDFGVKLEFDDTTDNVVWTMSPGAGNYIDFRSFGGLTDRGGLDANGKLFFSTFNFDPNAGTAQKQGTFIVKVRKT